MGQINVKLQQLQQEALNHLNSNTTSSQGTVLLLQSLMQPATVAEIEAPTSHRMPDLDKNNEDLYNAILVAYR
eukprot:14068540-Ditylum_brightwellii.AAC.1